MALVWLFVAPVAEQCHQPNVTHLACNAGTQEIGAGDRKFPASTAIVQAMSLNRKKVYRQTYKPNGFEFTVSLKTVSDLRVCALTDDSERMKSERTLVQFQ